MMRESRNMQTQTAVRQGVSQRTPGRLAVALTLILGMLMSGCAPSAGSETIRRIGEELNESLPTVSVHDTEQTRRENARFREVFFAVFPWLRP